MKQKDRERLIAEWIAANGVTRLPYMGKHKSHEEWEKLEAAKDFGRWRRQVRRLFANDQARIRVVGLEDDVRTSELGRTRA